MDVLFESFKASKRYYFKNYIDKITINGIDPKYKDLFKKIIYNNSSIDLSKSIFIINYHYETSEITRGRERKILNNGRIWIAKDLPSDLKLIISSVSSAILVRHSMLESFTK
jgi:hypothetical protein